MIFERDQARRMVRRNVDLKFQEKQPKVKAGQHYPIQPKAFRGGQRPDPPIGRFRVKSTSVVSYGDITQEEAQRAGYISKDEMTERWTRKRGAKPSDRLQVWRIEWEIIQVEDRVAA